MVSLILMGTGRGGSPRDGGSAGWRGSAIGARCTGHSVAMRQALSGCKVASDGGGDNGDISSFHMLSYWFSFQLRSNTNRTPWGFPDDTLCF